MVAEYSENNTKVYDCYKYSDRDLQAITIIIIEERLRNNLPVTRSYESYLAELKAHKRLYKLGVKRERTGDCDLEENIDNLRNIAYKFLGGF